MIGEIVQLEGGIIVYFVKVVFVNFVVVIIYFDVFGIWQNIKFIVDEFVVCGYIVLIFDLFNGDQFDIIVDLSKFDIMGWFFGGKSGSNFYGFEQVDVLVFVVVKYFRGFGYKRIGVVGYCIGVKVSY